MSPTASILFSGVAGWLSGARAADNASGPADAIARQNMLQLIHLRWIAVLGQVATILAVHFSLGFRLPLATMMLVLAALVALNLFSLARLKRATPLGRYDLFLALALDALALTVQLYLSGGATNPFTTLYLLHVILGAVLLEAWATWAIVALTSFCFVMLVAFNRPIVATGLSDQTFFDLFLMGMLVGIVLDAVLLVTFVARINANLRRHDARLAELRQRAAEETHIVRIGLLASGAAHELGTPLATLSVILGDWARMAPFAAEPELRDEIGEMQRQLQRCKRIVSGILMSAGEARGEAPQQTTLHRFLDELVAQWRSTRPVTTLHYQRDGVPDLPIFSDSALQQMLGNIVDNALEAAPQAPLRFIAECADDTLTLRVLDEGPGFAPEILARFGKPYQSSKGRPGGGLGLFLSVNVARTLGGRIEARNRPFGGAEVTVTLPLAALMPPEWAPHERSH